MDLNEILVFTRVVQAGSFTAAAKRLGMPKSSVSRKVSDLEDRMGARLLQRTTRKLGLTDIGRSYFEHCTRIVAEVEAAEQVVSSMQSLPTGRLRVTAPLSFGLLGDLVARYLKKYPDVQVDVVCTDRRVDLVAEGFDVAIRAGALNDSTLIARSIGVIKRVLVASPGYLRRRGRPRTPGDLEKHDCIAFGSLAAPLLWKLRNDQRTVEARVTARLVVNDFEWIAAAARAGIGIAWLPEYICGVELGDGRLQKVLSGWCADDGPIHVVYPTSRHLSPKVVAFVDLVRDHFK